MSGTLSKLIILSVMFATPAKAFAFDLDKELEKQNNVSSELLVKKDSASSEKSNKEDKDLKVTLIARK
jgi:hypothetical protein